MFAGFAALAGKAIDAECTAAAMLLLSVTSGGLWKIREYKKASKDIIKDLERIESWADARTKLLCCRILLLLDAPPELLPGVLPGPRIVILVMSTAGETWNVFKAQSIR